MDFETIAQQIVGAVGGASNIRANGICATRLRILVNNPAQIDHDGLLAVKGVLGIVEKGRYGIEVVLGPRLTTGVSACMGEITGIFSTLDELAAFGAADEPAAMKIRISGTSLPAREHGDDKTGDDGTREEPSTEEDVEGGQDEGFDDLLLGSEGIGATVEDDDGKDDDDDEDEDEPLARSILVINGPNINMLGIREPDIYGTTTFEHLLELCEDAAREAGFDTCECLQSNHEGDLVDYIQQALGVHDAIVINPAAYTHTSVALLDALKAVRIPAVEVHISAVDEREEFRQVSYVRAACIATIAGHGIEGYREAIELLAHHLGIRPDGPAAPVAGI